MFEIDVRQSHSKSSVLGMIGQKPAIEALIHHRGGDSDVNSRQPALSQRLRMQLRVDGWRMPHDLKVRAAREQAEIAWPIRSGRPVHKIRGVSANSIEIEHAQLAFLRQQPIRRRLTLEQRHRPFDPKLPSDKRADEQRDDPTKHEHNPSF